MLDSSSYYCFFFFFLHEFRSRERNFLFSPLNDKAFFSRWMVDKQKQCSGWMQHLQHCTGCFLSPAAGPGVTLSSTRCCFPCPRCAKEPCCRNWSISAPTSPVVLPSLFSSFSSSGPQCFSLHGEMGPDVALWVDETQLLAAGTGGKQTSQQPLQQAGKAAQAKPHPKGVPGGKSGRHRPDTSL